MLVGFGIVAVAVYVYWKSTQKKSFANLLASPRPRKWKAISHTYIMGLGYVTTISPSGGASNSQLILGLYPNGYEFSNFDAQNMIMYFDQLTNKSQKIKK